MRRDIGNEVIVAIAAVGVLAFALTFGIILSLSNVGRGSGGATLVVTTTPDQGLTETAALTPEVLETAVVDVSTATVEPLPPTPEQFNPLLAVTVFEIPTSLPTPSPTETPLPPTHTPLPTHTSLPPSATRTATATTTHTSAPTLTDTATATETSTEAPTLTDTATATQTPTKIPTLTPSETPTITPLPSLTPSATFVPSETPTLTWTPSDTPTATFVPSETPTLTLTPSNTATPVPPSQTSTVALSPTFTPSEIPTLTWTPSEVPTLTLTPTETPTFTLTPSEVPTLTLTPTETPTFTFTPSEVPTLTLTPTETPTFTFTPSETSTDAPTESPTPLDTPTVEVTVEATPAVLDIGILPTPLEGEAQILSADGCPRPEGWAQYVVRPGNTLFSIARAVDSSVGELRDANCLTDVDNIAIGQVLYVPVAPVEPILTPVLGTDVPEVVIGLVPEGCTSLTTQIFSPGIGEGVRGVFQVIGTASVENFQYYKLEVRPDNSDIYNFYGRYETPVTVGVLGEINSGLFEGGLHWVRLTVVDNTGNFPEPCAIPMVFR